VVLLHGASPGACSTVNWKPTIEPLAAAGFTVYAFDQPGFGYTDNPTDYSLEYRVTHARAVLDKLAIDRCHLIGNSMGGYIAARLAVEDSRTNRLVLVDSVMVGPPATGGAEAMGRKHSEELASYTPSLENMRTLTMGTLFNKELVTEDLVQERYALSTGKNYEAQQERRKAPRPKRVHEELADLRDHTLIVWGKDDRGSSVDDAFPLVKTIRHAELHVFSQCAHWPQWDQATRFNALVADFLRAGDSR
jgi:pimeloyl-ACP methyl ester carboxylesterase